MQQGEADERRQIAASSSYRNEVIPVRTERKQCAAELIPWGRNPFFATVVITETISRVVVDPYDSVKSKSYGDLETALIQKALCAQSGDLH
uniref:Transposase n=1 Tax=Ascaris lumbricoides TaxID=6252 RepID=A0A0M3HWD8_ASCLU